MTAPNWTPTTWGEVVTLRYGRALRDYREHSTESVPVYGTNGPVGFTDVAQSKGPGVIVGRKGAYRGVHYSPTDFWVIDTAYYIDPLRPLNMRWAYYALKQADINGLDSGSAIPSTSREAFASLSVTLPSLAEQEAIAEVLGALDDKIATNTALATAADSTIRAEYEALDAPYVRIDSVATSPRVKADPALLAPQETYVGLEHLGRRNMWLSDSGTAGQVTSAKSRFESRDVLFGKLRPYFHKVVGAPMDGICSTDILVLRARNDADASMLLAAVSSDSVIDEVVAASEGTRMPRTSWKDLASVNIRWPDGDSRSAMGIRLDSIRGAAEAALAENRALAETRDSLLPHLMSGKLRVRDAKAAVSAAGV